MNDPLDRLWHEVINLAPDASWLTQFIKQKDAAAHPIKRALPAMKRVIAAKAPPEDLSRVGRADRYTCCFNVLYSLDDPGLSSGKLAALDSLLAKHHPNAKLKPSREREFFESLWETINPENDGEFLEEEASKPETDDPFGDSGPAYKRLLAAGVAASDLALILTWHRYEACCQALRILSECCAEAEELGGLYTSLLSADPAGKEGRPGSWPLDAKANGAAPHLSVGAGQPVEKFAIKSVDCFDFTPDSRYIVACNSSLIRTFDSTNGKEVAAHTKAKSFNAFLVLPDSKHLVAALSSAIAISDVRTGVEVVRKRAKQPTSIGWTPAGIWVQTLDSERLLDAKTLTPINNPSLLATLEEGSSFNFSPDDRTLANACSGESTYLIRLRPWPALTPVSEWPIDNYVRDASSWKWSPDGRFILAGHDTKSIYDVKSGKMVWTLEDTEFGSTAFSPDAKWLVTGRHSNGNVTIWNVAKQTKHREFTIKAGWCFGLSFSPDGKLLGAATKRQCIFWDFEELVG